MKANDLIGHRYGRLTVIANAPPAPNGGRMVTCRCECGTTKDIRPHSLRSGRTLSCGCLFRELRAQGVARASHRMSESSEFRVWADMRRRCRDPRNTNFPHYGGRGIYVCDRWRDSFENFFADMGKRPPGMTLERKDNDGPYSPDNCQWATRSAQARNRRTSRMLTHEGLTMSAPDWADRVGIPLGVLKTRLQRGWSVARALTEELRK